MGSDQPHANYCRLEKTKTARPETIRTGGQYFETDESIESVSKRFSSVKIKANDHFNRRHTGSMSRIEM